MAKPKAKVKKPAKPSPSGVKAKQVIDPAVETFVGIVNNLTYKNGENAPATPLRNLTFWVGAGFSKAWIPKFPTSAELFRLGGREGMFDARRDQLRKLYQCCIKLEAGLAARIVAQPNG